MDKVDKGEDIFMRSRMYMNEIKKKEMISVNNPRNVLYYRDKVNFELDSYMLRQNKLASKMQV